MKWLGGFIAYDQNGPCSTTDVETECHVPQWLGGFIAYRQYGLSNITDVEMQYVGGFIA